MLNQDIPTQSLEYVLTIKSIVRPPLLQVIENKIFFEKNLSNFQAATVGKNLITDTSIRSVKVASLGENNIGNSVTMRCIYNGLNFLIADILKVYKEKVTPYTPEVEQEIIFQFLHYSAKNKGHYKVHIDDCFSYPRALTIIIGISDKDEYEGGTLHVLSHQEGIKLGKGDVVAFPSNFMFPHTVTPLISGTRKVIVAWIR